MTEAELQADLERGRLLAQLRDLAFEIADEVSEFDLESNHHLAVVDGKEWVDLSMPNNPHPCADVERALRYFELRGWLVRYPAFPNLVRVERPAASAGGAADHE